MSATDTIQQTFIRSDAPSDRVNSSDPYEHVSIEAFLCGCQGVSF